MAGIADLRAAVITIIHETNDIEGGVGAQVDRIDEVTQLLTVVSEGSGSERLEQMSRILQECRHSLNDVISKLNTVSEIGHEYNDAL